MDLDLKRLGEVGMGMEMELRRVAYETMLLVVDA